MGLRRTAIDLRKRLARAGVQSWIATHSRRVTVCWMLILWATEQPDLRLYELLREGGYSLFAYALATRLSGRTQSARLSFTVA